jgi:hypothetical protein
VSAADALFAILVGPIAVNVEQRVSGAVRAHARGRAEFLEAVRDVGSSAQNCAHVGPITSRRMRPISCARGRVRTSGPLLLDGGLTTGPAMNGNERIRLVGNGRIAACSQRHNKPAGNQRISNRRRIFRSRRACVEGFEQSAVRGMFGGDRPHNFVATIRPFLGPSPACARVHWRGSSATTKVARNSRD